MNKLTVGYKNIMRRLGLDSYSFIINHHASSFYENVRDISYSLMCREGTFM